MIDTVLFDLDDTLVDQSGAAESAVVSWATSHGQQGTPEELGARWAEVSDPHYQAYQRRELTFAEQRRARVREFLGRPGLSDPEADELFAGYLRDYEAGWRCFPDAVPTLRRLRADGFGLAILTNGDTEHQRLKLELVGLTAEIDQLIASADLPFGKPHPSAYTGALARLQRAPEQVLMVGDSMTKDVQGPLQAGMQAVLLDRHDRHAAADVPRITGLHQLDPPTPSRR